MIFKHPGYIGWTSKGVLLIHAEWPAYAVEHGLGYALSSLGQFPCGTKFTLIDDIDQCFLFVAGKRPHQKLDFPDDRLYIALWHEDVAELAHHGYIFGAMQSPYCEWAKRRAAELARMKWQHPNETWQQAPATGPDEFGDDEVMRIILENDFLSLNEHGCHALEQLLVAEQDHITEPLLKRARPAMSAQLYDSAVREACVVVETAMRSTLGSKAYGSKLVDDFFQLAESSNRFIAAQLKTFRTEVRSAFKFVRNEYAHNLKIISQVECLAILMRMSNVYVGVTTIADLLKKGG